MNYSVKDDHADVNFNVVVGDVLDSEGNVITGAKVDIEVTSSDDSVVSSTFDSETNTGSLHFGAPGNASVSVVAKDADGKILAAGGDNFTVTTGDPASISGITTTFEGLTPTPDAEPPAEPEA